MNTESSLQATKRMTQADSFLSSDFSKLSSKFSFSFFSGIRRTVFAHYILTIILGVFVAILVQKPHWMLAYTLMIAMQTFTLVILAMQLYPSNWMSEECHKVDNERYMDEIRRMKIEAGQDLLIQPPPP